MSPPKASAATWVYCVLRSGKAPSLARAPDGPPGTGKPRALKVVEGLWLLVSDAPVERFGDDALNERLKDLDWVGECALAHQQVIDFARKAKALVPLKLFTLFHSDERAVAWARAEKAQLTRALARVAGCAEFGVRLVLDERKARQSARERAGEVGAPAASGASFLLRKKRVRDAGTELVRGARAAGDELYGELVALARDARRRTEVEGLAPGSRLVMDGVFLVPDARAAKFGAAVKAASRALEKRGYELTVNGPWPAYHFVAGAA